MAFGVKPLVACLCFLRLSTAWSEPAVSCNETEGSFLQLPGKSPDNDALHADVAPELIPAAQNVSSQVQPSTKVNETGVGASSYISGWLRQMGRTWTDWVKESVRAQEAPSEPVSLVSISSFVQEHLPMDLKWMTILLGSLIGLALVWAAWRTVFNETVEDGKTVGGTCGGQAMELEPVGLVLKIRTTTLS
eukprot:symbB.v1.2.040123.t1/scaffold7007.1/size13895/1